MKYKVDPAHVQYLIEQTRGILTSEQARMFGEDATKGHADVIAAKGADYPAKLMNAMCGGILGENSQAQTRTVGAALAEYARREFAFSGQLPNIEIPVMNLAVATWNPVANTVYAFAWRNGENVDDRGLLLKQNDDGSAETISWNYCALHLPRNCHSYEGAKADLRAEFERHPIMKGKVRMVAVAAIMANRETWIELFEA